MKWSSFRSILISSATGDVGIPIQQLFRDYRGIEGQPLPFRNYNYNSLLDFLRSIKDTVNIVQNNAGEYFARPVGSGETQHILNMGNLRSVGM